MSSTSYERVRLMLRPWRRRRSQPAAALWATHLGIRKDGETLIEQPLFNAIQQLRTVGKGRKEGQ